MDRASTDNLHRTLKIEFDEGRASTPEEARHITSDYVLQIDVGRGVSGSPTRQAILLTAISAGSRAFLGGVRVRIHEHASFSIRWAEGWDLLDAIERFCGEQVESLEADYPTLVIGEVDERPPGTVVLYMTWNGWAGGVVEHPESRLPETFEFPLSGMVAAAIGVSESFQHKRGDPVAGRRSAGISLWCPGENWRSLDGEGVKCPYLPSKVWLIGLGHLGQAYAWALGLLPYPEGASIEVMLQDIDAVVEANVSTGMLTDASSIGQRKTRVVAERLEAVGFHTTITERRFDETIRRGDNEPGLALVGVDNPEPRRLLGSANFDLVIDAGLGGTARTYLEVLVHVFPSGIEPEAAWAPSRPPQAISKPLDPAYKELGREWSAETDLTEREIECGILEIAGQSVGAAFVGCAAATLVVGEALRMLVGGPRFEVVSLPLRSPALTRASLNEQTSAALNPGFVLAHEP